MSQIFCSHAPPPGKRKWRCALRWGQANGELRGNCSLKVCCWQCSEQGSAFSSRKVPSTSSWPLHKRVCLVPPRLVSMLACSCSQALSPCLRASFSASPLHITRVDQICKAHSKKQDAER